MSVILAYLLRIWQAIVGLIITNSQILDAVKALAASQATHNEVLQQALTLLQQIADELVPGPATRILFIVDAGSGQLSIGVTKMDLRDDQKVGLSIQPVDAKGAPARVDGIPAWASSDETVVRLDVDPAGMMAVAFGVAPGSARATVTADADMGAGVTPITGTLDFTVSGGGAVSINITAGTPEAQ